MSSPVPQDSLPDLTGLLDTDLPGHTRYALPERASPEEAPAVVLLIDEMESHISRLRFQLFLHQVLAAWPPSVKYLSLRNIAGAGKTVQWKGYLLGEPDEKGEHHPQEEPAFWQLLHDIAPSEDWGFWALVQEHFGVKAAMKAVSKESAQASIEHVIPPEAQARLRAQQLNAALPETAAVPKQRM